MMLFATFLRLFDNSKRCGRRCRLRRSYVDSSTSFMMLPDDPVLSREHYMHPHPVNRERNASQVVILLCLRRGKTRERRWGLDENPGETKSNCHGNCRSNKEDCCRENGMESNSEMFLSAGAVSIENPSSGYKRGEWSPADGNYVAHGPRAFLAYISGD
ncbi:hypothetical protein G5I_11839 [Acromyrmex echinatior]|uniref:Uncharacterized protein n=1 Tax=Acromyrmex echinatior TaxID=103372 RepID=F4X0Q6_ACREC|nr:hypothetical protein G5I_11839 [Acromyrmex echinatior]